MTDLGPLLPLAREVIEQCADSGLQVATAESCTGGLIAGLLTEIAGSSAVVDRGFVTYSNGAKSALLDVPPELIETVGAVSEQVAVAMAEGALRNSDADIAVAVTGVAGPGGGTPDKPVGLVHFAVVRRGQPVAHLARRYENRDRSGVRMATVEQALELLLDRI